MAKKENFPYRTNMGNPKLARRAHLAHSGSQSELRICVILPAHGFSNIIKVVICQFHLKLFLKVCITFHNSMKDSPIIIPF